MITQKEMETAHDKVDTGEERLLFDAGEPLRREFWHLTRRHHTDITKIMAFCRKQWWGKE